MNGILKASVRGNIRGRSPYREDSVFDIHAHRAQKVGALQAREGGAPYLGELRRKGQPRKRAGGEVYAFKRRAEKVCAHEPRFVRFEIAQRAPVEVRIRKVTGSGAHIAQFRVRKVGIRKIALVEHGVRYRALRKVRPDALAFAEFRAAEGSARKVRARKIAAVEHAVRKIRALQLRGGKAAGGKPRAGKGGVRKAQGQPARKAGAVYALFGGKESFRLLGGERLQLFGKFRRRDLHATSIHPSAAKRNRFAPFALPPCGTRHKRERYTWRNAAV